MAFPLRTRGTERLRRRLRATIPPIALAAWGAALLAAFPTPAKAGEAQSEQDQPIELGPLRVEDQNGALDRDTGLSVLPGPIQDIPQSIIVIPQQQLREQGVTSLEQALRNVPGITVTIGEGGTLNGDQFKIRGFDAQNDVYVDGLRDFGVYTRDSFAFQEVQVLKGPSGTMFGRGSTGGVINTVSKTPFLGSLYSVDGYIGNGDYYRGLADANVQINETTAFRVNLMGMSTGVVDRDLINSDRWGASAAVAFGLGTDTRLILNFLHQHDDRIPDYGVPVAQAPGELVMHPATSNGVPRSNFLQFNTDRDNTTADVFTERLTHQPTDWLVLTSDTRAGFYSRYFQYTTIDRCDATAATAFCATRLFGANPETAFGGIGGGGPYRMHAWGVQNISTARANFDIGMFRTEAIAGFDVSYQGNKKSFYFYTLPPTSQFTYVLGNGSASRANIGRNLLDPNHSPPPNYAPYIYNSAFNCSPNPCTLNGFTTTATPTTVGRTDGGASDIGLFLTDRLWFTEQWSVIGGVRYDKYNAEFNSFLLNGTSTSLKPESDFVAPRASLVWEPDTTKTFYFTWGRSARPQGGAIVGDATAVALTTKDLEPEITESYEVGAKYGFFDGRFSLTGALFNQEKNNATQVDPGTGFLLAQSGERQRVRGLELGVTGDPIENLTVTANWAYLESETLESFSNCTVLAASATTGFNCPAGVPAATPIHNAVIEGRQVIFVPKNSVSSWISYNAMDWVDGLSFGGGVTYQSKMPVRYNTFNLVSGWGVASIAEIPETVTLDTFISYNFLEHYRVSFNIFNLTDRLNYVQSFGNRGIPSPGRTFIFSIGASF